VLALANAAPFLYLTARTASERAAKRADVAATPAQSSLVSSDAAVHASQHASRWEQIDRKLVLWTVGGVGVADCVLLGVAWKWTAPFSFDPSQHCMR
jgi:hypothetical protein